MALQSGSVDGNDARYWWLNVGSWWDIEEVKNTAMAGVLRV
jgi:hypothetical protein